jgi:hypothetical protein
MQTPTLDPKTVGTSADRIDSFINHYEVYGRSEGFHQETLMCNRLAAVGFKSSASIKLNDFHRKFVANPELREHYLAKYPTSRFIPMAGLLATISTMKLSIDLAEYYAGGVPDSQAKLITDFELKERDFPDTKGLYHLAGLAPIQFEMDQEACEKAHKKMIEDIKNTVDVNFGRISVTAFNRIMSENRDCFNGELDCRKLTNSVNKEGWMKVHLKPFNKFFEQFRSEFFVVAPPTAFTKDKDFVKRFREQVDASTQKLPIPKDPLVLRFVPGGALIVASWGDEAEFINGVVNELGL